MLKTFILYFIRCCKFWQEKGKCSDGDLCLYRHGETDAEMVRTRTLRKAAAKAKAKAKAKAAADSTAAAGAVSVPVCNAFDPLSEEE